MTREEEIEYLRERIERAREDEREADEQYDETRLASDANRSDKAMQYRMKLQAELNRLLYPSSTSHETYTYTPSAHAEAPKNESDEGCESCIGCVLLVGVGFLIFKYCGS